jgi:predicted ATPase/class 3 adenylate cyclase
MPELPAGTVTFLFTDIEGSTRLWEQHPEAMRATLARHDALGCEIITAHEGVLVKSRGEGDSLFAVFARATDALTAACHLQQALMVEPWPTPTSLRVRMALHTGEADLREGDYYGPAVNRCARLRAAAHGGQVLLSSVTRELVWDRLPAAVSLQDLGEHRLRDLARPERLFQLLHPSLPNDFPPLRTLGSRPHNLPVLRAALLGRERDVTVVRELLLRDEVGLVTLTGPGGTGKTRLGLQVAAELLDEFGDGVFFVDLAPLRDPELVASSIAQSLGTPEMPARPLQESLKIHLGAKHLLLLLDNFEHVLAAASLVVDLLASCPQLKFLVTSRAILHLREEKEFPVSPLALPDPKRVPPVEELLQYPAVQLFVQRAQDVKPEFHLTSENARTTAEICHSVDGLPLAIELAAARIKLFSPQALLARLENRLKLLTGGARDLPERQQTLRSTIGWSYDLLDEPGRRLLRRLSVFAGGCTLDAAEAVCNAAGDRECDLLDGLASLVDQSLLQLQEQPAGESRFTLFETIREYGWEQLVASDEAAATRERHARYFLALAERARPEFRELAQHEWLERLEREHNNLRAALDWFQAEGGDAQAGLRLARGLWSFWVSHVHLSEGRERLSRLIAMVGPAPTTQRAHGLFHAGVLAKLQLDHEAARLLYEESLAIFRQSGVQREAALALINLAQLAVEEGKYEQSATLLAEALTLSQASGDWRYLTAFCLYVKGLQAYAQGDLTLAAGHCRESVTLYRAVGEEWLIIMPLILQGRAACRQGDHQQAEALFRESLTYCERRRERRQVAPTLEGLAAVAMGRGHLARATRLFGAARALRDALGLPVPLIDQAEYQETLSALRTAAGDESFAAAFAEGQAMATGETLEYALEEGANA